MSDVFARLREVSVAPSEKEAFDAWLELKDVGSFLRANAEEDEFIVYAGVEHTFMHTILVPASLVNPPDVDDLMSWNCNASSSWSVCHAFSEPPVVSIAPPLDHTGSRTLDKGEQLVFARSFEGRIGNKSYFEVLQKFVHIFDLHFLPERSAYCRLDDRGDIEDVICIIEMPAAGGTFGGRVVTFRRNLLDEYMALMDSVAVRTFDFTRYCPPSFWGVV